MEEKNNQKQPESSKEEEKSKAIEPKTSRRSESLAPYSFRDMQHEFDRMIERFEKDFSDLIRMPRWLGRSMLRPFEEIRLPSVDLEDKENEFILTADIPGFTKEDIEINVTDNSVELQAVKKEAKEQQNKERNYIRHERASEVYYRQIMLPEEVRSDEAKASLKDGILHVTLPKKVPKQKTKVTIT